MSHFLWRLSGFRTNFSKLRGAAVHSQIDLTMAALNNIFTSVFTPRWISRKASSGVLFFWGGEYAS